MAIFATDIEYKSEDKSMRFVFSDGHELTIYTRILRGFCPCAGCQGHRAGVPKFVSPHDRAIGVENVTPVGNYACCIVWSDRHDTGIYSWKFLRGFAQYERDEEIEEGAALRLAEPPVDGSTD